MRKNYLRIILIEALWNACMVKGKNIKGVQIICWTLDRKEYLVIIRRNFCWFCIKKYCDPSSEPSLWDGSDEGSQHMVRWEIRKIIIKYTLVSRALNYGSSSYFMFNNLIQSNIFYSQTIQIDGSIVITALFTTLPCNSSCLRYIFDDFLKVSFHIAMSCNPLWDDAEFMYVMSWHCLNLYIDIYRIYLAIRRAFCASRMTSNN